MKKTFIKEGLLTIVAIFTAVASFAQATITTGTLSPTSVCAGSTVSVPFTTTGVVAPLTNFIAQLSDATGAFTAPTEIGNAAATPITATIPAGTVAGAAYKIRVVSVLTLVPVATGSASALTINAVPAAPVAVNKTYTVGDPVVSLALSVTGTNLLWYTAASGGVGSATVPTVSTAAPSTASYWVTQSASVGSCESPRSKIDVTVNPAACVAPAAPVVVNKVYTVGDPVVSLALSVTGTNLLWYTASTGGTGSATVPTVSTAAPSTASYWVTQSASVGSCESPRSKIDVTVNPAACVAPAAPVVVNKVYTVGDPVVSLALSVTGTNLLWYTAASGGVGSATVPTVSTAAPSTASYWVTQSASVGSCESPRSKIDVTVNPAACVAPAAPVVVNKVYTVGDPVVSLALSVTGTNLLWYTAASGGVGSATVPTVSTAAPSTASYWVTQSASVGSCESPRSKIDVTVNPVACVAPAAPVVVNKTYTVGDPVVSLALSVTGTNLLWYTTATGGVGSATVPTVSTTAPSTASYWVTQSASVGSCESPRSKIDVTVNPVACVAPAAPVVVNKTYTVGDPVVSLALSVTGTNLLWYTAATGGVGSATVPTISTATPSTASYWVTQSATVGSCESPRSKIDVVVTACVAPAAPIVVNKTYTVGDPVVSLALSVTGTNLLWYTASTGGTGSATVPVVSTATAGTKSYWVTQSATVGSCESPRAKIDVIVNCGVIATPSVAVLSPVCQNSTVSSTVLSTAVTGTGILWYATASGGVGSSTAPTPVTTGSVAFEYYVTQTITGCESARVKVSLPITPLPVAPAVAPIDYCKDATDAKPLTSVGTGTLKWYNAAGTVLAAAPTPVTTNVGVVSYFVTQTVSGCEGPKAEIKVTTNALPGSATVAAEAVCQEKADKAYPFSATGDAGNTFNWYSTVTAGTKETATPSVNLKNAGETTYYVAQVTAKGCESAVRVAKKIRVKRLPGQPANLPAPEYCQFLPAVALTATFESGATPNWYGNNATGGTAVGTAPTPSTLVGGTISFYVSQTLEACESDRAKIDVLIKTTPKPTTTTSLAFCQGADAAVLSATGDNLKWYREANGTTSQPNPFTPFTQKVEDYSFFVTQTGSNGCESPKEEIKVHIKALPSATISGNTSIALGETAQIRVNFTSDGPWNYVLSNGVTGSTSNSSIDIAVKPSTTTTYVVTEVSNTCGKGIPVGSALVTVRIPTINTGNPSAAEICAGKTFQLPFQQSGNFPEGNKFTLQISTVNEDAKFVTIPSTATSSVITATVPDSTKGGAYFLRIVSSDSKGDFLVKGSVAGVTINVNPLPVATLSGTKTILAGQNADLKIEFIGKAPWTFNLYDGVKDSSITAPQTPFIFLVKPKATTSYTIRNITNVCGTVATGNGTARIQVDPILGIEPAVVNFVKVYPTIIETRFTVELDEPVSPKLSKVEVLDMSGRAMTDRKIKQKVTEMDLTNYPGGLYLIKVQNGNHSVVHRILKK